MTFSRPDPKPFADLFNRPEDFNRVFESIEHTIFASFAIDEAVFGHKVTITQAKVQERWQICERWFRAMRGELGYGLIQTLDMLPKALACTLLDQPFEPPPANAGHGWFRESVHDGLNQLAGKAHG